MKKQDEIKFAKLMLNYCHKERHNRQQYEMYQTPRKIINSDKCDINYKRCWYYLKKWANKDYYDWGVTMDLGWLTIKGEQKLKEMVADYND